MSAKITSTPAPADRGATRPGALVREFRRCVAKSISDRSAERLWQNPAARKPKGKPSEMVIVALRPAVRAVRGSLEPRDLKLLAQWIDLNRDVLIDYWNDVIEYTEDTINALKRSRDPRLG